MELIAPWPCWICGARPAAHVAGWTTCGACNTRIQPFEQAWRELADYLRRHWRDITTRGSFDLSKVFPTDTESGAVGVHLHFVATFGAKLAADRVGLDLSSWAAALMAGTAHSEVSLIIADSRVPAGKLCSYDSDVSVLRERDTVQSALWTFLVHPIAIKVCYLKAGAPVKPPSDSYPWHPTRQRKIVKLSPYKGDTQSTFARRDLRI
jgi:hypothetical protein